MMRRQGLPAVVLSIGLGLVGLGLVGISGQVHADGSTIDKVYDPYVNMLEKEIEYRVLYEQDTEDRLNDNMIHKLGYGQAVSDRLFVEVYLVGAGDEDRGFDVSAYEVEMKWQITEQGELDHDWGFLVELEKEHDLAVWEASATLIGVHEWTSWVGTANLSLLYEWGEPIKNEVETALSTQLRYRYSKGFEPAVEIYLSDTTTGLGPLLTGQWRFGNGQNMMWELGSIIGTNTDTPQVTWKFNLEYEFY